MALLPTASFSICRSVYLPWLRFDDTESGWQQGGGCDAAYSLGMHIEVTRR